MICEGRPFLFSKRNKPFLGNKTPKGLSKPSHRAYSTKMELKTIVQKLQAFAPLSLAEKWDNVGLLVGEFPFALIYRTFKTHHNK
jgi:hypothetical protein